MGAVVIVQLMFLSLFPGESFDTCFYKRARFARAGITVRLELSISQFVVIDANSLISSSK